MKPKDQSKTIIWNQTESINWLIDGIKGQPKSYSAKGKRQLQFVLANSNSKLIYIFWGIPMINNLE